MKKQEHILDNILPKEEIFTDKDLFIKIWSSPRKVFKFIHENDYNKSVMTLVLISSFLQGLNKPEYLQLNVVLLGKCIGAMFIGAIIYLIYGSLISKVGKWFFKGEANTNAIIRVLAYSAIFNIVGKIFILPILIIRFSEINLFPQTKEFIVFGIAIIQLILMIWGAIVLIIGIAEIQKYSIFKAIVSVFLPLILLLGIIILIAFAFFR